MLWAGYEAVLINLTTRFATNQVRIMAVRNDFGASTATATR